jgi:beta-glucosidase-like glycosyl hydrolase
MDLTVLEVGFSPLAQRLGSNPIFLNRNPLTKAQAALFPCGISLAATWNKDILFQVGEHLADEVKARSAEVLLAPTVCLHRGPLGGRNFESYSEDPYLTGKLAASYINGLQGKGIAATIKREYFVVAHHVPNTNWI